MEEFSLGRPEGRRGRLMEGLSSHSFLQFFQKFFNWPGLWAASYNGGCPLIMEVQPCTYRLSFLLFLSASQKLNSPVFILNKNK